MQPFYNAIHLTNLANSICLNAKINEVKNEIPSNTNIVTNAPLKGKINEVKNTIPNINNLATNTALTAVKNKIPDHSKYITNPEFKSENFAARLAQANLARKSDIANFVKKP